MHVGRDEKIPVAINTSAEDVIVSSAYFVFKVVDESVILKEYLYIQMNSPEFDRYAWFCTDSSVRGGLDWDRFCDMTIDLPSLPIQQKYVDVYNAMLANQRAYEQGLEDLKLTCDAYIERLRHELPHIAIGEYIESCDERNDSLEYGLDSVKGISIEKRFIETKANMEGVSLKPYKLIEPDAFSFVTVTSRNGEKISLAHNGFDETYICSSSYEVFRVSKKVTTQLR
jgi:type I restriction enzyme S subunit